jgi:uncharacterized protein GlcG (DUF336 family)
MATLHLRRLPALAAAAAVVLAASACTQPATESPATPETTPETTPGTSPATDTTSPSPTATSTRGGQPDSTVQQERLSVAAAMEAAQAALEQCQADGLPFVSVAVVDRSGTVQVLLRGDNAAAHTAESAERKAYTSAVFGVTTAEAAGRISGDGPSIQDLPGTLFLAGGVPIRVGDTVVAGIGVGGAPDGARDEACADAGAAAVAEGR